MAKETKEERRARIEKEVAERSAARREAYFEKQAESKAAAEAKAPELPPSDAYNYNYVWRQDVGAPTGELKLVKTPNPYYDPATNEIVDPATGERRPAKQSMWSGPTTFREDSAATGTPTKTPTGTPRGTPTGTPTGAPTGTPTRTPVPAGLDAATVALIQSLQAQITSLTASQAQARADTAAAEALATQQKRESALAVLTERFSRYGLASLVPKIRELISTGASEDTIALQLQDTEEYKQRFIANQDRLKKGLAVLDPGTYIGLEDRYRQILRAYGLKQFDNDAYVTQFLANDVSPEELSSRVVTAVQRVQNADPAVSGMLRQFYGIGTTDMVAYVLDPSQQFPKIERQVAAAEIGVAAARQGLRAGVNVAEQLAAQGITQAEAQRGYSTIANILPQATKLSEIYTDVLDQYGQAEAEQEVFNSLASAQRKRQRLAEREIAAFSGQSGLGRGALGSTTGGQI